MKVLAKVVIALNLVVAAVVVAGRKTKRFVVSKIHK